MLDLTHSPKVGIGYAAATLGVTLITLLMTVPDEHINATTVALTFVLFVLVIATLFGSRPALVSSVLGGLSFNFFFLPPYYTWNISASQNWIAFIAFVITAVVAGQLSSYARRRAEESETRRGEIEKLYTQLQDAFEQASSAEGLRRSEQLKSALLDAVTHDLRTPLTSIKASVTTLLEFSGDTMENGQRQTLDAESHNEFLDIINEETDRLNGFIGGMVDLARIEAGRIGERRAVSDVGEIISETLDRGRSRLKDHRVEVSIEQNMPDLLLDATAVDEVLYTVLDNAAKYSPTNSLIRVDARIEDGGRLQVRVQDQGRGVVPASREKVFEKFYRSDEHEIHSTASGLGLGLAIARGIIASQGGSIRIEDGLDGFVTSVVFEIPVYGKDKVREIESE